VLNWAKTQNFDIAAKVDDADLSNFKTLTGVQRNQMLRYAAVFLVACRRVNITSQINI
jgi:hypothetical protein